MNKSILNPKPLLTAFAFSVVFSSGIASAQEVDEETLLRELVPELNDPSPMLRGATGMSCLVDTPAYDHWGSPNCFSVGSATYATAIFRIDNPPSNYTILWSDSSCNSGSLFCSVPIRWYTQITMNATVLNHSNNTFTQVSATAWYEGPF